MSTAVHELTAVEAHAICAVLHAVEHIDVEVALRDGVAYVHTVSDRSTPAAVTTMRAFRAVSDRVVWDGPR